MSTPDFTVVHRFLDRVTATSNHRLAQKLVEIMELDLRIVQLQFQLQVDKSSRSLQTELELVIQQDLAHRREFRQLYKAECNTLEQFLPGTSSRIAVYYTALFDSFKQ